MKNIKGTIMDKICRHCLIPKSLNGFTKNSKYKDGYNYYCKGCIKEYYSQPRYARKRKEIIKKVAEYNKKNRHMFKNSKRSPQSKIANEKRKYVRGLLNNMQKIEKTIKLINCSVGFLKQYIEKLWRPGMSWENYAKIWELDHIEPCCVFDLTKEEELFKCFHYTNYQPILKEDHYIKNQIDIKKSIWRNKQLEFNF